MRIIDLKPSKNGYGIVFSHHICGRVTTIKPKSPAAKAKMQPGQDIIAFKDVNEAGDEELINVADLEIEELKKMIDNHLGTLTLHVSEFQQDQSSTGVKRQTKPPPPPPSKRKNVNLIEVSFFIYFFSNRTVF